MKIGQDTPAIVTGGASGLGRAVAEILSASGVPVTILDMDPDKGGETAETLGIGFQQADVTDSGSVAVALSAARTARGQERICVNCAGIAPAAKTFGRSGAHDFSLFRKVIDVNLNGSFNVASQSAAGMVDAGLSGVIIHTASIAAFEGQIGQAAYAASKGGIAGLTLPMARDLARNQIRVMAIAPGIFATPMVTSMSDDIQEALASGIPNPARLGDPAEFAGLARHIVENDYLNGSVIRLDGATRLTPR